MIPLCTPDLTGNEALYLQQCVETTFVSSVGPFVSRFEEMVASASGSVGAVATASGTCGLHVALTAMGVGPGDLVVLPTFTFIASANAISHCGAQPWLMDVDCASWTLDPAVLRQQLSTQTEIRDGRVIHKPSGRRVAAVMPVHTLGLPSDMDAIVDIARQYGLPVVADSAAALGATYKGRLTGDLGANLTVYSFNGNKTVTAGGGGAVVGQDRELLALVRHLSTTARSGEDYDHDRVGFNYRMTNLQAAVGCAQMERLDKFVAAKRRIAAAYDAALSAIPAFNPLPAPDWAQGACWFSGVVVDPALMDVVALRKSLREQGIEARSFWKPVHLQKPYAEAPRSAMPVSEAIWKNVVILPCSTHLTEQDLNFVIDRLLLAVR